MRGLRHVSAWVVVAVSLGSHTLSGSVAFAQATAPDTSGTTIDGTYGPHLPPDISQHGHEIDRLLAVLHWSMAAMFVFWCGLMVFCIVRFRQRPGRKAVYQVRWKRVHLYFVAAIAVFELALDAGMSNPVLARVKDEVPNEKDAVVVRVVAEQFAWTFHYPGADGVFGRTAPEHVNVTTNPVGLDPGDPHGEDDVVSGTLHVPVNHTVICRLTSKDVIHSFYVPVLRVRQDVIPGMRIPVWFHATETGTYQIACAQLCGNNHYNMKALMIVEPTEAFTAWLAEQAAPPEEFIED